MRGVLLVFLLVLTGADLLAADTPAGQPVAKVPTAAEVVRYELSEPGSDITITIPPEQGAALLSALEGGAQVKSIPPMDKDKVIDFLPVPPDYWLEFTLANGIHYTLGIFRGGVYLPEGIFDVTDAAQQKIAKITAQFDAEVKEKYAQMRKQLVSAERPLVYTVGQLPDDGGTLSSIARMFYGNASDWKKIYEANKATLKDPNVLVWGTRLTIPK
jgi:hypothetical protein